MKSIAIAIGVVLAIVAIEFALIYIFEVDASILNSLKYIIPAVVAVGIVAPFVPKIGHKAGEQKQ